MSFSSYIRVAGVQKALRALPRFCLSAALFAYGFPAQAQLIDYDSLQSLFGEPVTTSATGVPQRASDVPVNMTIITADQIRQSGTRSIPQIIGLYVPGVDILRGASNSYDVGIRGYQQAFQSGLLVLIDGRQVFVDDYSRTIWDNLPINVDDVRQIEVIKGASSAFSSLFGSNAGYGVINIITYSPLYDKNDVANLTVGTQRTISGDGTATIKGDGWGSKFTVGGMNADEFNTPRVNGPSSQPFQPDSEQYNPLHSYFVNSSVFQLSPVFQVNTEVNYSESRSNTADYVDGALIGDQKTTSYSARAGFNWQSPYGVISNNNYYNSNYSALSETTDSANGDSPYGLNTQLLVSQLQDQFKVGDDHIFRIGTEYRYQSFIYGYSDQLEPQSPKLDENNFSANGMWLWQINDKLSLTNALRFDSQNMNEAGTLWPGSIYNASDYTHTNNAWSGNSGIVYKVTERDTVGLGYGRGILLPSMIENGGNIVSNFGPGNYPVDTEGNPYLKPTVVQNYELDYTRTLPNIFSSVRVSPYYTYTKDIMAPYITTIPNAGIANLPTDYPPNDCGATNPGQTNGCTLISGNSGGSHAYGGEIEFKGSHEGFRWDTSYSLSYVKDDSNVYTTNDFQDSAPESHVRLLLGYTTGPLGN